jgi:hypothetical protein
MQNEIHWLQIDPLNFVDPITVIGTLQEFGCFLTVSCSRQLRQMDEHLSESTVKMMWWWWQSEGLLRWRLEAEKIRRAHYSWFTILTSSNVAELGAPLPHTQEDPVPSVPLPPAPWNRVKDIAPGNFPLRYGFPTLPCAKARNPPKRTIAAPTTLMPCPWQLVGVAC